MKQKHLRVHIGYSSVFAFLLLLSLGACHTLMSEDDENPLVYNGRYMDEGSTLVLEDPYYTSKDEGLSLLEALKKASEELKAECEKNSLLAQELISMREARDDLKKEVEGVREKTIGLTEQIAALKTELSEREGELSRVLRERQDLLEKLVNLKIEKIKIEKELLKIKIAALSGEG